MAQAEQSKFSGALSALRKPVSREADAPPEPPAQHVPEPPPEPVILRTPAKARPTGKRSNPAYRPTTVILRKATVKAANRKLEDTESRLDLSDLIEQLLTKWIS